MECEINMPTKTIAHLIVAVMEEFSSGDMKTDALVLTTAYAKVMDAMTRYFNNTCKDFDSETFKQEQINQIIEQWKLSEK